MDAGQPLTPSSPAAVYDRVVREARQSFGHLFADDVVVTAAREAVDELLVRNHARVTTFIPVLAMRKLRDAMARTGTWDAVDPT